MHREDNAAGLTFINGVAQVVAVRSQADLYIEGPTCTVVGFEDPSAMLVAPYGIQLLSSQTIPWSQITNGCPSTTSSYPTALLVTNLPTFDEAIIRTSSGSCVKIAWELVLGSQLATSNQSVYAGFAYAQHGYAPDGF